LARDIAELKRRADEAERPWYRNASTTIPIAISVLALVASIAVPATQDAEARRQRQQDELTTKMDALNKVVEQIADLRRQNTEQLASASNLGIAQTESQLLNIKKLADQEQAKKLLQDSQIAAAANPSLVRVLAGELGLSGEEGAAKGMLEGLLRRHDVQGWDRAYSEEALAYWELLPDSSPQQMSDGRQNMERSIAFFQQQSGEYAKEALVGTQLSWANQELLVNNRSGAERQLQAAQKSLDLFNPLNEDKPFFQRSVLVVKYMIDGSPPGILGGATYTDADRWLGSWTVAIAHEVGKSGLLLLSLNKQTNLMDARMNVFDHSILEETYIGSGVFLREGELRIDWLGVVRSALSPNYPPTQTYGYTTLTLNRSGVLTMETYLLGEAPVSGRGRRK
jgi:hypothetical protein